jgi:hypothetical protein
VLLFFNSAAVLNEHRFLAKRACPLVLLHATARSSDRLFRSVCRRLVRTGLHKRRPWRVQLAQGTGAGHHHRGVLHEKCVLSQRFHAFTSDEPRGTVQCLSLPSTRSSFWSSSFSAEKTASQRSKLACPRVSVQNVHAAWSSPLCSYTFACTTCVVTLTCCTQVTPPSARVRPASQRAGARAKHNFATERTLPSWHCVGCVCGTCACSSATDG